jgi:hypothetical protein
MAAKDIANDCGCDSEGYLVCQTDLRCSSASACSATTNASLSLRSRAFCQAGFHDQMFLLEALRSTQRIYYSYKDVKRRSLSVGASVSFGTRS